MVRLVGSLPARHLRLVRNPAWILALWPQLSFLRVIMPCFNGVLLLDQAQRQEVASSTGKAARTYVYFQGAEDSVVKEYISQTVDGFLLNV